MTKETSINKSKFKRLPKHVPEFAIMEDGPDMLLSITFLGSMEYDRKDSKHVARMLRRAAAFVIEQA